MINRDRTAFDLVRFAGPARQMAAVFAANSGCRIGESTVASKKLHLYHSSKPRELEIIRNLDAGILLYSRNSANQIIHLDIFHECGQVDHQLIAHTLKKAAADYNEAAGSPKSGLFQAINPNFIDVQTATGGGRITGSLSYGQKAVLQNAHQNHVHLAALLPDASLTGVFFLVSAVEEAILCCGLQLRCLEKLTLTIHSGNQPVDLSGYTDQTDSLLNNKNKFPGSRPQCKTDHPACSSRQPDSGRHESGSDSTNAETTPIDRENQILLRLKDRELQTHRRQDQHPGRSACQNQEPLPGIAQHIHKLLQYSSRASHTVRPVTGRSSARLQPAYPESAPHGLFSPRLDITATIQAAAARKLSNEHTSFNITGADLMFNSGRTSRQYDLCMILDASASMEGLRLQTAKAMISRLFSTIPCRISLIAFQDKSAKVELSFTNSRDKLQTALNAVQPYGATPLALGLKTALDYLKTERTHRPLLALITDGLSEQPGHAAPLDDALAAAREIKAAHYRFTCIGLVPGQQSLAELAQLAGGSLYPITKPLTSYS